MPRPGMLWRHVITSTINSWLPGDPRGFRNKDHRIHSSGDYKNPPPPGEHAGLRRYAKVISAEPVIIPVDLRPTVGHTIVRKLFELDCPVLAIAVAGTHTHFLAELPEKRHLVRKIVGQCKSASSHAIRDRLPGRAWAYGEYPKPIRDINHQRNAFQYILDQQDAWVWCFRDGIGAGSDELRKRCELLGDETIRDDG